MIKHFLLSLNFSVSSHFTCLGTALPAIRIFFHLDCINDSVTHLGMVASNETAACDLWAILYVIKVYVHVCKQVHVLHLQCVLTLYHVPESSLPSG